MRPDVTGDRGTHANVTARFAVTRPVEGSRPKLSSDQPPPRGEREQSWHPGFRRESRRAARPNARGGGSENSLPHRPRLCSAARRCATRAGRADNLSAHERAGADTACEHSLRDQTLVRQRHCVARDIKAARQLARRWQAFAWTQPAVQRLASKAGGRSGPSDRPAPSASHGRPCQSL